MDVLLVGGSTINKVYSSLFYFILVYCISFHFFFLYLKRNETINIEKKNHQKYE